ncbi:MAG: amidohydrolase family protein [Candidatus Sulfobium sp.]|jgi:N-acetylglucosamine-6-phosphate deacetylase
MQTGFIDLHTHGSGGYDTRTDDPRHILRIAEMHGRAGTKAILPTIYSGTVERMRRDMEAVRKAMETKVPGEAAIISGVHLEGPFLNPARCGAQDRDSFSRPSRAAFKELTEGYVEIIKLITVAPEMPGALKVIERCVEAGIRVNMGHSDATCRQALEGKKAGASGITHIFNAMRPFHHREPGIAGLGLTDEDLYTEVIADGYHLHTETLRLIFKCKSHRRIILVSDSVRGGRKKGRPVYDRTGALAGSGITLCDSLKILRDTGIPQKAIVAATIDNPKRYLGTGKI